MNRCRIIRGIIVVIFIACLCLLEFICSSDLSRNDFDFSGSYKLIYVGLIVFTIFGYSFLKKKLESAKCKKSLEYIYRYIYLLLFVLLTRFIATYLYKGNANLELIEPALEKGLGSYLVYGLGKLTLRPLYSIIIINTVITGISMIFVKRIVFNITTNELLSAIAAIFYIFIPQAILSTTSYERYNFNVLFNLIGVYLLLKVIDEIKQHKLTNSKYIKYTFLLADVMLIDILFGGSIVFWVATILISALVSKDVDYLHLSFKKSFVDKFSMKTRRIIYKIERVRISKYVAIILIVFIVLGISILLTYLLNEPIIKESISDFEFSNIGESFNLSVGEFKLYYLLVGAISIIIEMMCFTLGRKQDTKSAIVKAMFILALTTSTLSKGTYSYAVIDALLVTSLVINMGNIYYNREEKIKLLKEVN